MKNLKIQETKKRFESYLENLCKLNVKDISRERLYYPTRNPDALKKRWDAFENYKQVVDFILPKIPQGIE